MTNAKRPSKGQKKGKVNEIESAIKANVDFFNFKFKKRSFKFTEKQKEFIDLATKEGVKIILLEGPAGSSKTLLGVYCALLLMKEGKIDNIMYLRSVVESAQRSMGFLKGDADQKLSYFTDIIDDKLTELVEPQDIIGLHATKRIETMPINYIRGCSWRRKFILADESQNFSLKELLSVMTRIGEESIMILAADRTQSDINNSGFADVFDLFNNEESEEKGIHTFKFTEEDIVRSEIVKYIVKKFKEVK